MYIFPETGDDKDDGPSDEVVEIEDEQEDEELTEEQLAEIDMMKKMGLPVQFRQSGDGKKSKVKF